MTGVGITSASTGLTSESELTLHGLASGQTVKIHVSARNGRGGESVSAPALQVVVP